MLGMGQKLFANNAVMLGVPSIAREEEFALNTERNTHGVATKDVRSEPRKVGFALATGLSSITNDAAMMVVANMQR